MVSALKDPAVNVPKGTIQLTPVKVLLKNDELATAFPVSPDYKIPRSLLEYMTKEFNEEIERGQTYPQIDTMGTEEFEKYWFGYFAAILLRGDLAKSLETLDALDSENADWSQLFLGTFYVKPNYPGRCSEACNAGFVVNPNIRRKGTGTALGKLYLQWAPKLGYTYSVFNLVFATNVASMRIWDGLGFERIGLVKKVAWLKGYDEKVDAIIYGKDLTS